MSDERFDHAPTIRGWLHEPVDLAPLDIRRLEGALDGAPQGAGWLTALGPGRFGGVSKALSYLVGAAAVTLLGGVLLFAMIALRPDDSAPPMIGASPSASPSSAAPTAVPAPTPTAPPTPELFGGSTLVVAQDGSGDHVTISDAIAAATDGDTIRVRPGRYDELLMIDKNVAIVGDGPRETIVIAPTGPYQPTSRLEWIPTTVYVHGATARLRSLTVRDERMRQGPVRSAIFVDGSAAPIIEDVAVDHIEIGQGSSAAVRDNDVGEISAIGAGAPIIESNRAGEIVIAVDGYDPSESAEETDSASIRDNVVERSIIVSSLGQATTVENNQAAAIVDVGLGSVIRGNTVGSIDLGGSDSIVRDNAVDGPYGIVVQPGAEGVLVEDNEISARRLGIGVGGAGPTTLRGNSVTGSEIGMLLATSALEMESNTICDNDEDVRLLPGIDFDPTGKGFCDPLPGMAGQPDRDADEGSRDPDENLEPDENGLVFRELKPGINELVHDGAGHYPAARWVFNVPGMFPIESTPDGRIRVVQEQPEYIDGSELGLDRDGPCCVGRASFDGLVDSNGNVRLGPLGVVGDSDEAWIVGEPGLAPDLGPDGTEPLWAAAARAIGQDGSGVLEILARRGTRPDGLLWAEVRTQDGRRAARFDGERWTVFPRAPGPWARQRIEDGAVDAQGNLWFSNDDRTGFVVFDGHTYRTLPFFWGDTGEKAFDAEGNLWVGLDDTDDDEDDRAIGLVRIDRSLLDQTRARIGDPELGDRFPATIIGSTLEVVTLSGPEYVARFAKLDPAKANPVEPLVTSYLEGTGKSIDELSVGYTMFEPAPDNRAFITAVRVRGTDASDQVEAVVPLLLGNYQAPSSETVEIAGKTLDRITDGAMPGAYPQYTYPAGDTVWVIDAEEPVLSEIVRALP